MQMVDRRSDAAPERHANPTFREAAQHRRILAGRTEHPLGVGAEVAADHRTGPNRRALSNCLRAYFAGTLADKVTKPQGQGDAAVGLPLGDRFVTRLEIGAVLDLLRAERADLWQFVHLAYGLDLAVKHVAERLHVGRDQARNRLDEALDWMIVIVWVDGR